MDFLLKFTAYILAVAPFVGGAYLFIQYINYFRKLNKEPPKDKPNVKIWIARGFVFIPLIIGFKIIFLPFLFLIRPQWMLDMLYVMLLAGWLGFVSMVWIFIYKKSVSREIIGFNDYKTVLEMLLQKKEDEKISVYQYLNDIFIKKTKEKYREFLDNLFNKKQKPMFQVWNSDANNISEEIKIFSQVRVKDNVYYNEPYKITLKDATRHIHILAPTGSGKTKSILSPLMQQAIDKGVGIISIDPKGDTEVMNSIIGLMSEQNRLSDLKFLDLAYPERSHTYNPLATNNPIVCQSIINATLPEQTGGEFYVGKQQEFVNAIMSWMDTFYKVMGDEGKKFNFIDLYTIIAYLPKSIDRLLAKIDSSKNRDVLSNAWIKGIKQEAEEDKRYSGFLAGLRKHISRYAFLSNAVWLINDYNPDINVQKDLDEGKAITFFLRALKYPAGESIDIGKMLLMDIQAYASKKQEKGINKKIPNLLFIDEAASILPKAFLKMFDMARSAGIGIAVAHQDMSQFKPEIFKDIFNNSGTRVILRAGDVETAKYFSLLSGEKKEFQYTYGTSGYNIFDSPKEWLLPHWTSMAKESMEPVVRPEELLDIPLGGGFVFSNTNDGNIKIKGKTYFFAKEYNSINIENLFPINKERLEKWREGGLNLIDEMSQSDMEKAGIGGQEGERVKNFKAESDKIKGGDFTDSQVITVKDMPQPDGRMFDTVFDSKEREIDDTDNKTTIVDGDVLDTDVVEHN